MRAKIIALLLICATLLSACAEMVQKQRAVETDRRQRLQEAAEKAKFTCTSKKQCDKAFTLALDPMTCRDFDVCRRPPPLVADFLLDRLFIRPVPWAKPGGQGDRAEAVGEERARLRGALASPLRRALGSRAT